MAITRKGRSTKERILSACVKLFLEKGYTKTTVIDITREAKVSNSSFQHFFGAKDGVLTELLQFMYDNQFNMAAGAVGGEDLPPAYVYAIETATQLALTELNENIREVYLESYTHDGALELIQHATAKKLHEAFGSYQPELSERDFYLLDIGTAGMMRGYMNHRCDDGFTLEDKIRCFLTSALRALKVPEDEVQQIVAFVLRLDIRSIANRVMEQLFQALSMRYDLTPPEAE